MFMFLGYLALILIGHCPRLSQLPPILEDKLVSYSLVGLRRLRNRHHLLGPMFRLLSHWQTVLHQ